MSYERSPEKDSNLGVCTIIWRNELPPTEDTVFVNSAFFRHNGRDAKLPSPQEVREKAISLRSKSPKPHCVPFTSQRLLIKYRRNIKLS